VQRDYVLRLIEQAAAVLKELMDRLRGRRVSRDEVLLDLKRVAFLGNLDLDLLRVLDANAVRMIALQLGQSDPSRIWLAAEMLYLDGMSAQAVDDQAGARSSFAKALMLYGLVEPTVTLPGGFPEVMERMQDIETRLAGGATGSAA
jgi:hypothetical protein